LVFIDESGFSLVSPLKRSWAPRGQTPRIRTSLNHKQRLNLLGALLVSPRGRRIRLRVKSHSLNLNGRHVLAFLKELMTAVQGPVVLVWDNAPIHTRRIVQDFIARQVRLHVYSLPRYAPELNPVEFLWTQTDEHLAGRAPRNLLMLKGYVHAAIQRTRVSQRRLHACLCGAKLNWSGTGVK
jgi:transposase